MATIYHNPRCSKSRATLELLKGNNVEPDIVLYLQNPPDSSTILQLASMLEMTPGELLRKGEAEYKTLGLGDLLDDDSAIASAISQHPILLERPIVVIDDKAVIGRPPENILSIL